MGLEEESCLPRSELNLLQIGWATLNPHPQFSSVSGLSVPASSFLLLSSAGRMIFPIFLSAQTSLFTYKVPLVGSEHKHQILATI